MAGFSTWYHGTDQEAARIIALEGFRAWTYFTPELASALGYGGSYVFRVRFAEPPSQRWQWCCKEPILPDRIIGFRHYSEDEIRDIIREAMEQHATSRIDTLVLTR